jgi:GTP-binding protein EngB required for normal cell division
MDLREYEQAKFTLAEILRGISHAIPDALSPQRERARDLFARLAEDRFNLVVVGRFSRGKTSLMNAILGSNHLPTGLAPLTSVITAVTYGSKTQVVLRFDNRILDAEVPLAELPRYITQQGNPGNVKRIKLAEIQLPVEILRRGFYFVDTPGLGSVIAENTLTTESFLPEADAFILVTSYDSPLSEEEIRFFKAGAAWGRRIFVVINKHDTVSPADRDSVLAFVRRELDRVFGPSAPQLFSVSATEGVEAKRLHDPARLAASGIAALEKRLIAFLLTEKQTEFLLGMCERVRRLLYEMPHANELAGLAGQLDAFAATLGQTTSANPGTALDDESAAFPHLHRLAPCEICADVTAHLWDFIRHFQYDLVVKPDARARLARLGGLCSFHTWQYESIASPYGICSGYPDLLDRLADKLHEAATSRAPRSALARMVKTLLPSEDGCAMCRVRVQAERNAVASLARRLERDSRGTLDGLSAICQPHFAMLVEALRDDDAARSLIMHQAVVLRRFSEDMRRYALKHDAVRRYLASGEETTVAERGLMAVAGDRRVSFAPQPGPAGGPSPLAGTPLVTGAE